MARLDPLIRYRKHIVDEKQRVLGELLRQVERLEAQKQQQLQNLARETELMEMDRARAKFDTVEYFGLFAQGVREKIALIEDGQKKLEARINMAREDVREAFAELKKIEIVDRNRKDEQRKDIAKKESASFDETAIARFKTDQRE